MSKKAVWLSDIEFIEMHSSDWERLESEAFEADESVQAQLNPNQHVVLDWLKKHFYKEDDNYPLVSVCRFVEEDTGDEFSLWFKSNRNLFVNALANGYEVEKDQLYKVVIDHKYLVQLFSGRTDARLVEYEELTNWHDSAYKLTESVIKSIDERYWPFAVKVEGE
ncbi:DUF1642 domain-containing protein [Enterococcus faecalis]|nr:DUF1642 domain-containing protein [Enterococcus faecalis]EGO5161301.1 DUF1642 domain-containing protein [Enterococcus faecalis]EGO5970526.1 DUF1642 domain-containing protein [Enterococcus faecalis]